MKQDIVFTHEQLEKFLSIYRNKIIDTCEIYEGQIIFRGFREGDTAEEILKEYQKFINK